MAQFGPSIQTAQVTTGSFRTTVDPYVTGYAGYPTNPGNKAIPGSSYYDSGGASSTATTATPFDNEFGRPGKYRYVRYYSSSNPALSNLTAPAPVYWVDTNYTTVTPVSSESLTGLNSVAGILMPNTTDLSTLINTATAVTQTQLNGNFVWICVGGYVAAAIGVTPSGTVAAGDALIGSTTTFEPGVVTAGTAPGYRVIGYAQSALNTPATGQINLLVTLES